MPDGVPQRSVRQNRAVPTGEIRSLDFRGLLIGNRGILHDGDGRIVRRWLSPAWIICTMHRVTRSTGEAVRLPLMEPGHNTILFFLDEVAALAAGHRPCFLCRHREAKAFLAASGFGRTGDLDRELGAERLVKGSGVPAGERRQRRHAVEGSRLPSGACVLVGSTVFARRSRGDFIAWSEAEPRGYLPALVAVAEDAERLSGALAADAPLTVLTPPVTLRALAAGYGPLWHPTAWTAAGVA